jgi:hypothetical protein
MKKILTGVLTVAFLAAMVILAFPGMAQFDPGKKLGPKPKTTEPSLNPTQQAQADKLAKERQDAQLKANAERKKAEKARAEELNNAKSVTKVPVNAPPKQPTPVKK